uniref:Bardet-Biedl syndrome 12 n=1 Tax=Callorhinchus milii TaxID=7868 RepID=A0A4W3HZ94_CALMI
MDDGKREESHIGLEQLAALAASGRSLLGSIKSYKFIVDDETDESAVTCSAFRLLENLHLNGPIGQLLNETVQTHHKLYKTGTSSLLFLVGAWSKAVLNCLNEDIPIPTIVSVMSEGLDNAIEALETCQVHIDNLLENFNSKQNVLTSKPGRLSCGSDTSSRHLITGASPSQSKSSSVFSGKNIKLHLSRHFRMSDVGTQEEALSDSFDESSSTVAADCATFRALAMSLSHGNQSAMQLTIEAYRVQIQYDRVANSVSRTLPQFDIDKLVTCLLPGLPEHYSCVNTGFITLLSGEQPIVVQHLSGLSLHVILIDGDLTHQYHHPGFNRVTNMKIVAKSIDNTFKSVEEEWLNNAIEIFRKYHVNVILVKGIASPCLMEKCIQNNILVIQQVKDNVVQGFVEATGAILITYITQVKENCVGTGAHLCFWKAGHGNSPDMRERVAVQISCFKIAVITVVLCSPVNCKLQVIGDQLWSCVHRLHHALSEQRIFPGAGATELMSLCHLKRLISEKAALKPQINATDCTGPHCSSRRTEADVLYKSQILQFLADGWREYLMTAMYNTGMYRTPLDAMSEVQRCVNEDVGLFAIIPNVSDESTVYDNVTVKLESWRRALDLVLLVLQADVEIITGYRANTSRLIEEQQKQITFV